MVFGIAGGEHRLGIGAPVIRGNQYQRCLIVVLAKLLGQSIAGKTGPEDNHRRMNLVHHRLLVVRCIVHRLLFQQFKVFFTDPAIGAEPVLRHIFPFCTRSDAIIRPAFLLVVDQAANNAFILTHVTSLSASPEP